MPVPVGVPPGQKVEIEFVAGTWVDVSADVEVLSQGPLTTHYGRTSQFAQPGPGQMSIVLRNEKGQYTPQRQFLADGTTPHPHWPNVLPRKRIRRSYTIGGTTYYRFFGYIQGWPPTLEQGVRPITTITATTRDDYLSRVNMQSPIRQEITLDKPLFWWPLTDAQGSTQALEQSGNSGPPLGVIGTITNPLVFGVAGPGFGDGTGVSFAGGQTLQTTVPPSGSFFGDLEVWVQCLTNPGATVGMCRADLSTNSGNLTIGINTSGQAIVSGLVTLTGTSVTDGGWHHIYLSIVFVSGFNWSFTLFIDGVNTASTTQSLVAADRDFKRFIVGGAGVGTPGVMTGNLGQVALYTAGSLSSTRIAAHTAAGLGYYGDTTDARIARFLGYAGLTSSDWNLDVGQILINTYPQDGKTVVQACQDMATTEGGGSAFYVTPDGRVRFSNRRFRDNRTPIMTLDASIPALLDPGGYAPAFDETTLVNTSTVSRDDETGTLSTQTYSDPVSVAAYQPTSGDVTTYTLTDLDALALAQTQVNGNSNPAFRLDQVTVNMHASQVSLYGALAGVEIGSRIRVTNLPPSVAPTSTIDLFVEGWTETVDAATYKVVFDTSPADNPRPRAIWDVSTWDGGDVWAL
jgi:hypothetical protein